MNAKVVFYLVCAGVALLVVGSVVSSFMDAFAAAEAAAHSYRYTLGR